ncbi:hypothetical protein ASE64_09985 [Agreia sp. Leaf210]|nr:hypothetical protein ASE64_09985 [Agreia sp. Leaf210]
MVPWSVLFRPRYDAKLGYCGDDFTPDLIDGASPHAHPDEFTSSAQSALGDRNHQRCTLTTTHIEMIFL